MEYGMLMILEFLLRTLARWYFALAASMTEWKVKGARHWSGKYLLISTNWTMSRSERRPFQLMVRLSSSRMSILDMSPLPTPTRMMDMGRCEFSTSSRFVSSMSEEHPLHLFASTLEMIN